MNCHGLAKVKDKEAAVLKRGNALFQKVLGVTYIDYPVLSLQCQHQTSES